MDKPQLEQQISDLSRDLETPANDLYAWLIDDRKKRVVLQLGVLLQTQAKLIELLESDLAKFGKEEAQIIKTVADNQRLFSSYLDQQFADNLERY